MISIARDLLRILAQKCSRSVRDSTLAALSFSEIPPTGANHPNVKRNQLMSSKRQDLTTAPFMAWLKKQPRGEEYEYTSNRDCLVARYLKSRGWVDPVVGPDDACDGYGGTDYRLPGVFMAAGAPGRFQEPDRTLGAALKRANAFLKQRASHA